MGDFIQLITISENDGPFGTTELLSDSIYAEISSIGMKEFYAAQGTDKKIDIKFKLYATEYNNEQMLLYNGLKYRIVRTYITGLDKIELICARC